MKFLLTMSALIFSFVSLAAEESNNERIKREIKDNGFAIFTDIASSPLNGDDIKDLLSLFAATSKPPKKASEGDIHATAYESFFFRGYDVIKGQLYEARNEGPMVTFEQDAHLHRITKHIVGLLQVPENALKMGVQIFFYSDCEKALRKGLSSVKSCKEHMIEAAVPKLHFHQDRRESKKFPHRKYYLYFQVLKTQGFCPHYSRIGNIRSDQIKPPKNPNWEYSFLPYEPVHYDDNSVEHIVETLCKDGSGYVIDENTNIVHGHSGFKTYISRDYKPALNERFGFEADNRKHALDDPIFRANTKFEYPTRQIVGWRIEVDMAPLK